MDIQWITIAISILALILSLISLWKSYLAPFKLKVAHDAPTFALYKITSEISGDFENIWWIPSFDIGFTFHNLGIRSGELTDIRLLTKLKSSDSEKKYTFYAKWIVDYAKFQQNRTDRFKWIEDSIKQDWYPLIFAGNEQKSFHIIFEGFRWDEKFTGILNIYLEIFSSQKKKWIECDRYCLTIVEDMYENKSTHTLSDSKLEKIRKIDDDWLPICFFRTHFK